MKFIIGSPKTSKNDIRSTESIESPQISRNDLRYESDKDYYNLRLDSPKLKIDYYKESPLDSPRMVSGLRNLHLDDNREMEESGYYSPGDTRGKNQENLRRKSGVNVAEYCDQHFDSFEGHADVSSEGTTPEPVCK